MSRLLPPPRRTTLAFALGLGLPFLGALALLTLTPLRVEQSMPNLIDLAVSGLHRLGWTSIDFNRLEVIANVLAFVPVGVLAFLFVRVWPLAFLVGPVLSIAIETVQGLALPHRAATVNDILANSAGATIGVLTGVFFTLLFAARTSPRPSPSLETS